MAVSAVGCGDDNDRRTATAATRTTSPAATVTVQASTTGAPSPNAEADARLIERAGAGDLGAVHELLREGASVYATDARKRTALIAAAYGRHFEVARALIEAGADLNVRDDSRQSAHLIATSEVGEDDEVLEFLRYTIARGADVTVLDSYNGTGLIRAADRGYVSIVRELLETTATDIDHVNNLGWTALLEAVILGHGDEAHTEVVRLLIEAGADVNLADRNGTTPYRHAKRNGYSEIAELLAAAGGQ